MEVLKNTQEEFVTVVSVGSSNPELDNFVTVLSIGNGTEKLVDDAKKRSDDEVKSDKESYDVEEDRRDESNGGDGHPEEEVDVFRLPGERLGFGLKFEGGNKTTEKVRKLFVQSCASESPASRAVCSWGTLGEGDEVLSIDGVPVTQMTRLDCVRRLKESQLVIKLLVRYRGALRPEVVSAERKPNSPEKRSKVPPELPSAPPPVPPRKLRQPRGPADGDANPSPVRKPWDSPKSTSSSSLPESPVRNQTNAPKETSPSSSSSSSKSTPYESCTSSSSPGSKTNSKHSSPKTNSGVTGSLQSPDLNKSRQELPEASIYTDARSHDGCSTHGSTSDDTGSSMSTVIDRFSSDRFSTVSTISTTSTTSEHPHHQNSQASRDPPVEISAVENIDLVRLLAPFDQLEREFGSNPPTTDYLLNRLANSEAVTFVEALGDGNGLVERVTAVVAPNTVLIEETITLQPPLSFQDAPLSYGHETRPGLAYTDLAADSTTHFRPIKDDALIVDCVNGNVDQVGTEDRVYRNEGPKEEKKMVKGSEEGPPLPARNHVNRINVNQEANGTREPKEPLAIENTGDTAPALPPKPMPRKDVKSKRKRPPPPPPPPTTVPRREVPPLLVKKDEDEKKKKENELVSPEVDRGKAERENNVRLITSNQVHSSVLEIDIKDEIEGSSLSPGARERINVQRNNEKNLQISGYLQSSGEATNKMLEIIEMKKTKALLERSAKSSLDQLQIIPLGNPASASPSLIPEDDEEQGVSEKQSSSDKNIEEPKEEGDPVSLEIRDGKIHGKLQEEKAEDKDFRSTESESGEKSYRSLDRNRDDDIKDSEDNGIMGESDAQDDEDSTDESDGDSYYWQSNLATIGEEEETNSLEFVNANRILDSDENSTEGLTTERSSEPSTRDDDEGSTKVESPVNGDGDEVDCLRQQIGCGSNGDLRSEVENQSSDKNSVNGRMENCGGGQRLPPDGDEFPATYQEFSSSSHQYQFVAAARVSSTLQVSSNCGGQQQVVTGGDSEVFSKSETFKLIPAENKNNPFKSSKLSNDFDKSSDDERDTTAVPQDSRVVNSRSTPANSDNSAYKEVPAISVEKNARKIIASSSSPMDDYSYCNGSCGPERNVVSEKKFTVSGYYGDDAGKTESIFIPPANESPTELSPPPLPTTRPPKVDVPTPNTKNLTRVNNQAQQSSQRKFLLNGDLWRQDDKSEKSVRDKIAMFSSQSSLEAPLFPSLVVTTPMAQTTVPSAKRLSKYKSSEDVFADKTALGQKEKSPFTERTRSSFDLSTPSSGGEKYSPYPPSLPLTSPPGSPISKNAPCSFPVAPKSPPHEVKPSIRHSKSSTFEFKSIVPTLLGASPISTEGGTPLRTSTVYAGSLAPSPIALNRATSFSAGSTNLHSRSQSLSDLPPSPQISRTNSLASTFKRPNEDMRRTSLNQLIEQRRKGISKLRGLVIPEKEALPVSQPIVDLPEIKSRDSILLQQIPRANILDKWGSQSSISSSVSTASVPGKMTFKMPEPQNLPKYSPAFKRKSLAVYGSSASATTARSSPSGSTAPASEAPKSLESICSPTRSDFSFEYVPTGGSPRSRANLRKARTEYDDSDNDSAVSSSQSSISRGFSPPVSPVPSERSTLSSERSYLSAETTSGHSFHVGESRAVTLERAQFTTRPSLSYQGSERSSSSSSSPDPRSPQQSEIFSKSHLHSHPLKRSSSTDTNCSTSSTLTSGSQASAESLSRRVLKPQSVEAINRKNILASARCRSGRDLNGSPLIQRKFSDDEETPVSKLTQENGSCKDVHRGTNGKQTTSADVKIAYIDVTETFVGNDESESEAPKLSPKRNFADTPEKTLIPEPSNDLKKWVRAEVKTLVNYSTKEISSLPSSPPSGVSKLEQKKPADVEVHLRSPRRRSSLITEGKSATDILLTPRSRSSLIVDGEQPVISSLQNSKPRSRSSLVLEKNSDCQNDLLTVLSTKSRSRSTIHVEERSFSSLKTQMSLEEILDGKGDLTVRETIPANIGSAQRSWAKDLKFTSKIPTPERPKLSDRTAEEGNPKDEANQKINSSRIPTPRSLGRRSASVTDMKRAIEKSEQNSPGGVASQFQHQSPTTNSHGRFPSLDSSVDEGGQRDIMDSEKYSTSEQFGSISSLASSTSLISQQELAQLVEEATLEEPRGAHDVIVVLYHKENPAGSVGIALAGGVDCETKEITVHRVLAHSIADKDGRVQRGDRILSINGRSTKGLSHRESLAVLKQPRSEVVLVVSRARDDFGGRLRSRTESVETIVEGSESNGGTDEQTAWGPPVSVAIFKDGAGLGFSLEGGRDSPLGDRPLIVKKIFAGGAAEKTGALRAGDQILEVNGSDVTRMSRIEAWSLMKKLHDGEVSLLVRHPATKSSF